MECLLGFHIKRLSNLRKSSSGKNTACIPVDWFLSTLWPSYSMQTEVYFRNWLLYGRVRCQHFARIGLSHTWVSGTVRRESLKWYTRKWAFHVKRVSPELAASFRRLIDHFLMCFMCKIFNMGWKTEHEGNQVLAWFYGGGNPQICFCFDSF